MNHLYVDERRIALDKDREKRFLSMHDHVPEYQLVGDLSFLVRDWAYRLNHCKYFLIDKDGEPPKSGRTYIAKLIDKYGIPSVRNPYIK